MKKILLFAITIFSLSNSQAQTPVIKGLYVDGFSTILGDVQKEDSLLNYASSNSFNYLALYDLWTVHTTYNLTTLAGSTVLAAFIQKAHQVYTIDEIGAVGENFYYFNNVIKIYNQQHTNPLQKFDVFNVEFEFWNVVAGDYYCTTYLQPAGLSCDTAGAFTYYKNLIRQVDSVAALSGAISELYVGWFNQGQAIIMGNTVDRILLHDYINNYSWVYSYISPRLQLLAARNQITKVIPIFSAEPAFLGSWITTHPLDQPFYDLDNDLSSETGLWKQYIDLQGYQWFAYNDMPPNPIATGISEAETVISIFPNPANEIVIVKSDYKILRVSLYDIAGDKMKTPITNNLNTCSMDVSGLLPGIYICKVETAQHSLTKKLVVIR